MSAPKRPRFVPTVIIDRNALFRAGLEHILSGSKFRVVACVPEVSELPERLCDRRRCVVLISIKGGSLPLAADQIGKLREMSEHIRIVCLADTLNPDEVLTSIAAGVDGYLVNSDITADYLIQLLEFVLSGGVVVPQGLASELKSRVEIFLDNESRPIEVGDAVPVVHDEQNQTMVEAAKADVLRRLTNRERTILRQLTQGASNKQIARELNIVEATVKVHVRSLLRKIQVDNRTQAAMWAARAFDSSRR